MAEEVPALPPQPQPGGALQRLKEARLARRCAAAAGAAEQRRQPPAPQPRHAAAASDADNHAYLRQLERAFGELGACPSSLDKGEGATAAPGSAAEASALVAAAHQLRERPGELAAPAMGAARGRKATTGAGGSPIWRDSVGAAAGRLAAASARAASGSGPRLASSAGACSLAPGWRAGPVNDAGVLVQLSERPLLCSARVWGGGGGEVVVGGSDHALYVVDAAAGRRRRTLFSRTCGHTEWVTTVCALPGGRLLSGGMDGRLWLWPAAGSVGAELPAAHAAPVSKVACLAPSAAAADDAYVGGRAAGARRAQAAATSAAATAAAVGPALAVSCSYDKTIKVWDLASGDGQGAGRAAAVLRGHGAPVLELAVAPADPGAAAGPAVLTGDRGGRVMAWDVEAAASSWGVGGAHEGHVTALSWQPAADGAARVALSGGQDGRLRAWDPRSGACVAEAAVHAGPRGRGAVGGILAGAGASGRAVVTAGADMALCVLDPVMSYRPTSALRLSDFPYCLQLAGVAGGSDGAGGGSIAVCGCGDGTVHVVDVDEGRCLYALGAGRAAVRAVEASAARLVCAGDDGAVVCYEFDSR